jgi:hypothetical protein
MKRLLLLFFLCLVFAGCESAVPLDGVKRSPKQQIDVYTPGQIPNRPYKVIALFAERDGPESEPHHQNSFINQSKKMGADGIILKPTESGGVAYSPFGGGSQAMFRAEAIVYDTTNK